MKRFIWLVLIAMLLPSFAFSKPLTYEMHLKHANKLVSEGHLDQAINYLSAQSKRKNLGDGDRLVIALFAVNHIFKYGDKQQALYVIKPIYDNLVKKYGIKSNSVRMARTILISAYLKRKEHNKALEYANIAIQSASTKTDLVLAYRGLADVYCERKEHSQGIKNYLKAERFFKQLEGNDRHNSRGGTLYNNLAIAYAEMDDFQNALESYRTALKIEDKKNGSYYRTLSSMANAYRSLDQADKAKGYFIEIADYYLKAEGINSLDYIKNENEIGVIEADLGHHNEALIHYKKVLDYGERLGRDEIKALALRNMGSAYHDLRDDKLALYYLKEAQAIYQKLPLNIELATNYEELAIAASKQKLFEKELNFYDKSLEIRKALYRDNDPDYAKALTNKAMAYKKQQEYTQANAIYQQAFTLLEKVQPKGENMLYLLVNLADLRVAQKDYDRAEAILLEAIDILKLSVGEKSPKAASAYNEIASIYSLMDHKRTAVEYYKKAIEISKETNGPKHSSTKAYYRNLLWESIDQGLSRKRHWR